MFKKFYGYIYFLNLILNKNSIWYLPVPPRLEYHGLYGFTVKYHNIRLKNIDISYTNITIHSRPIYHKHITKQLLYLKLNTPKRHPESHPRGKTMKKNKSMRLTQRPLTLNYTKIPNPD